MDKIKYLIIGLKIFQKCEYVEMYADSNFVYCAGAVSDEDIIILQNNYWTFDGVNSEWKFAVR